MALRGTVGVLIKMEKSCHGHRIDLRNLNALEVSVYH